MAYMSEMLVSVVETDSYLSKARKVMSEAEMEAVVLRVSASPMAGDVIQGTGGLRKLRSLCYSACCAALIAAPKPNMWLTVLNS